MLFKEVFGHEKIKQHLVESYRAERTAHAQIFLGKEGNGALALALAYAQFLLCEQPADQDACGTCGACRKTNKYVHPDLHFSYPTVGSKAISTNFIKEWRAAITENPYLNANQWLEYLGAENKQGNITKDECVSIVQRLSYKALEGRFKIMILWLPEYLGKEGNRLLKLIEEPRPNTVFLLISEEEGKILNTILSRCQLVNIPRLEDEQIAKALEQNKNLSAQKAQTIAYLVEGNYNKACALVEDMDDNNATLFVDWLRVCYQGKPQEMVQWVEGIVSGKHPQKDFFTKMGRKDQVVFLQYALYFLKEFLSLQLGGGQLKVRLQKAELTTAQNMLKVIGVDQLQELITLFDETAFHIERNGNPRILFLDVSIKIHHILRRPKLVVQ
ncbi:DNA polymerase III subunit gamma/tau [Aureispira sp. CCB-QB1]|uniref:DNA polymerase III subunit n=1 Tax=Aureispira sp. CCB-QB1 TaxID=1313421 RepID=UPI000698BBF4|nr:DNA polymerase III subunit gamma/tau [Aureispira sp. CCB-QB1]